ncbi:MAG TPA: hypothetical protein VM617_04445 [Thermoanaerobaculia bacterium]|nr:hypothetical protein [Thermoanaerobaculia bacterium]
MTGNRHLAVRRACARAILLPALAGLAACGPGTGEIERSPVETADAESAGGLGEETPAAAERGRLVLTGDIAYDGAARVRCGPAAPRGARPQPHGERQALGRLEASGEEPQVGEATGTGAAGNHDEAGFDLALEADGLAVTLHLPAAGEDLEVPLVVAVVGEDGAYRESPGRARIRLDDGAMLTRSSATDYVSGRFSGSWDGDAGSGEVDGEVERCFYFD